MVSGNSKRNDKDKKDNTGDSVPRRRWSSSFRIDNNKKAPSEAPVRRWSSSLWKNHPGSARRLPMMAPPRITYAMERPVRRKPSWFHRIPTNAAKAKSEEKTDGLHDYRDFLPPLPGSSASKQNQDAKQQATRRKTEDESHEDHSSPRQLPIAREEDSTKPLEDNKRTSESSSDDADAISKLTEVMDMPTAPSASISSSSLVPPRRVSREEEPLLSKAEAPTTLASHPGMSRSSSCSSMSSLGSSASESDYALARAAHIARKKAKLGRH